MSNALSSHLSKARSCLHQKESPVYRGRLAKSPEYFPERLPPVLLLLLLLLSEMALLLFLVFFVFFAQFASGGGGGDGVQLTVESVYNLRMINLL